MGVYKRGDSGKWWVSYSVGGKLYREAGGTKAQATALLAKRKAEIFEGRHFPDKKQSDLTFAGLRDLWLEHAAHKKSIADDRQRFSAIMSHFGATTRMAALTPTDVQRFKATLAATKSRRGTVLAPATVNRHLALLRAALRLAEANHYIHPQSHGRRENAAPAQRA